jgi:hypothetical protein
MNDNMLSLLMATVFVLAGAMIIFVLAGGIELLEKFCN